MSGVESSSTNRYTRTIALTRRHRTPTRRWCNRWWHCERHVSAELEETWSLSTDLELGWRTCNGVPKTHPRLSKIGRRSGPRSPRTTGQSLAPTRRGRFSTNVRRGSNRARLRRRYPFAFAAVANRMMAVSVVAQTQRHARLLSKERDARERDGVGPAKNRQTLFFPASVGCFVYDDEKRGSQARARDGGRRTSRHDDGSKRSNEPAKGAVSPRGSVFIH